MTNTACKFFKKFRGSMPPDPPRAFLIFNMLQNNFAEKQVRLKICRNWVPLPEKISEFAADMKTFFKGLISSNVFVFN